MLFSLLKHYLDTDTALKVSQSVYCFTTSISHGVENYFPRLWGTGISDAIFLRHRFWYNIHIRQQRCVCSCMYMIRVISYPNISSSCFLLFSVEIRMSLICMPMHSHTFLLFFRIIYCFWNILYSAICHTRVTVVIYSILYIFFLLGACSKLYQYLFCRMQLWCKLT